MPVLTSDQISAGLAPFGLRLSAAETSQVADYLDLLLRWNRRVNLTSIREPTEILSRHFGESLYLTRFLPLRAELLVDVGTGAGFPGLALKIPCPQLHVVLVESVAKKIAFLKEVTRTLGFDGVEFGQERFQHLAKNWKRALADVVTARAVGSHHAIAEASSAILKAGGRMVFYLGRDDADKLVREASFFKWQDCRLLPGATRSVILLGMKP